MLGHEIALRGAVACGSFEIENPTTAETAAMALPATGWTMRGSGSTTRYTYRDDGAGPCASAQLQCGRLKAVCQGAGMGFSLDEPAQGSLRVRMVSGGTDTVRYCLLFGGTIAADRPAAGESAGIFRARNAAAPADCG